MKKSTVAQNNDETILWTYQSQAAWRILSKTGRLKARWSLNHRPWQRAYKWIAQEMVARQICSRPIAPIWAWHSCYRWEGEPDRGTAEALLCWDGAEHARLTLAVPSHLVLLSHYGYWNVVRDRFIDCADGLREIKISASLRRRVFAINERKRPWVMPNDDIQACLPYLSKQWVVAYEKFKMPVFK